MVKEKEQICLEAVSQVLRDNFGADYFSVVGPKECAACLERSADGWKVYCVERGNEFDAKSHHNLVEACVDLIVRIGINDDPEDLIDRFYSLIIGAGDALALQFDCERYEASLARTGEPASLEDVENISMRCDARALAEYARQKGVSTLDLSDEERMMFCKKPQEVKEKTRGTIYTLPSEYIAEGRKEGRSIEREEGNRRIYALVEEGELRPSAAAKSLGITVEQLMANMEEYAGQKGVSTPDLSD